MLTIRPETPADIPAIYAIHKAAFRGRDAEPRLVDALRASERFIPELSLVAEEDTGGGGVTLVGHILFSRIAIAAPGGEMPALALAPLAVLPSRQGRGVGSALARRGLADAARLGHAVVIVLGHPNFYTRFGFSPALARALECPFGECGDAWMAAELVPGALDGARGSVIYPAAFAGV